MGPECKGRKTRGSEVGLHFLQCQCQGRLSRSDNRSRKFSIFRFWASLVPFIFFTRCESLKSTIRLFTPKFQSCLPPRPPWLLRKQRVSPPKACVRTVCPRVSPLLVFTPRLTQSGKNWHDSKKAFRPSAGLTSYAKRVEARKHQEAVKEREREMREEKETERQVSSRFLSYCFLITLPHPDLFTVVFLLDLTFSTFFLVRSYARSRRTNITVTIRRISSVSRTNVPPRRKRLVTRRWPRRCIANGSSVSGAGRSATSCSTHDLYDS